MTTAGFKELLDKHRTGAITATELELLQQWLHAREHRAELESLFGEDLDHDTMESMNDPALLNLIYQQVQLGMYENEMESTLPEPKRMNWWRVAAAAVLLLLAGAVWFLFDGKTSDQPVKEQLVQTKDLPAPQETRATLTLADGSVIAIDSVQQGLIAKEGATQISMDGPGEIRYDAAGSGDANAFNTLTVPKGSKPMQLTLSDGTKVWLNVASSIRYPARFKQGPRTIDVSGEVYLEVAKRFDNHDEHTKAKVPFLVNVHAGPLTGNRQAQVEVLGTHFNVSAYEDDQFISTSLLEGSVKVSPANTAFPAAMLIPGQQAQFNAAGDQQVKLGNPDMEEVMAWKNGRFAFAGAGLPDIMRQIARWYNIDVSFEDTITDSYTISISRNVPLSRLIEFIELSGGARLELNGNRIVVKKEK
ncbi:FecR family protein [Pseudoflavitalea rhizosphaerae]|uniref:FecR family protein n=1 Tax=Pseudoflavitalea rhizosphaerae TaxID=1884793 RepID=UPI000F8C4483|nr:FecR family protein [Pseudoflavitalea rhizosphaerae]